ncbi:hypothetical protein B0I35DRAFT_479994 [Stachybotrys elegans]|uniref:Fructose-bisphosphate aldolase n=1 Tax=Stachybotrys elegans TaxID=80388 RepID=A0A8K0WQN4_9HYPO|nr:hypothetical protein B0I35DRAFT_479994 [Stachybotrys elegans]
MVSTAEDEEIFSKYIKAGVVKININKGINKYYADVQKEMEGKPLTAVMEACTKHMQKTVERYMKWFGSAATSIATQISSSLPSS